MKICWKGTQFTPHLICIPLLRDQGINLIYQYTHLDKSGKIHQTEWVPQYLAVTELNLVANRFISGNCQTVSGCNRLIICVWAIWWIWSLPVICWHSSFFFLLFFSFLDLRSKAHLCVLLPISIILIILTKPTTPNQTN